MGWHEVLEQGLVSAKSAKRAFTLLLGVPTPKMDLIMVHHYKHETSKRLYSPRLGVRVHATPTSRLHRCETRELLFVGIDIALNRKICFRICFRIEINQRRSPINTVAFYPPNSLSP